MSKLIIGIDPGLDGGLVKIEDNCILSSHIMPTFEVVTTTSKGKSRKIRYIDTDKVLDIFKGCSGAIVYIEKLKAIHKIDSNSNFRLGEAYGSIKGIVRALGLETVLISPIEWQKLIIKDDDKVYELVNGKNKNNTKKSALNAASRIFPGISFLATKRSKKAHDGMVDAALIASAGCKIESNRNI